MKTKQTTCPDCGSTFDPRDHCWYVCDNCFQIIEPDEDLGDHKPDNCIKRLGSYYRRYSMEDAKKYQQKKIEEMRP